MQLYMTHPHHGKMPVYNNAEIESNKKNGWTLEQIEPVKVAAIASKPVVTEASEETPKENGANCPKCGKTFARGLTMHMKYCNG